MGDIDTAAIRAEGDRLIGRDYDNFASAWHEDLVDEIDALAAKVDAAEALWTAHNNAIGSFKDSCVCLGCRMRAAISGPVDDA